MKRFAILTAFLLALTLSLGGSVYADHPYVSFKGQFKIMLPDDWQRIDYRTVDYYLSQSGADLAALNYDAVFSPQEGAAFMEGQYLILTVDSVGSLDETQIDSVLKVLGGVFGEGLKYMPEGNIQTDLETNEPVYDPTNRTVSVLTNISDITEPDAPPKRNLYVMKFYELGIANFYFYSADSLFEESKSTFADIVNSFTTEDIEVTASPEQVKVADLTRKSEGPSSWLYIGGGLVIVLLIIVVLIARRLRKSKAGKSV